MQGRRAEDESLDLIEALPELPPGPGRLPVVVREFVGVQDLLGPLPEVRHDREEIAEREGLLAPEAALQESGQGVDRLLERQAVLLEHRRQEVREDVDVRVDGVCAVVVPSQVAADGPLRLRGSTAFHTRYGSISTTSSRSIPGWLARRIPASRISVS